MTPVNHTPKDASRIIFVVSVRNLYSQIGGVIKYGMLITIFKKTELGWIQIQRYHKFTVDSLEDAKFRALEGEVVYTKINCPGCGKLLTRAEINDTHLCNGSLTDEPIQVNRPRVAAALRAVARTVNPPRPRGRPKSSVT